jgi:2-hydroxychromene-2-carboxylate isomerase
VADPRLSQPVFFYDLGSPGSYLVAEQVMAALPVVPEWEPVLGGPEPEPDRAQITALAGQLGLQPVRWPAAWPPDSRKAMLAATYAKRVGRAVAFSLAAFRQAFAGGRDLGQESTVLIAAAACEMHPTAMLKGIELRSVHDALSRASERAAAAGITAVPAIQVGDRVFEGVDAIGPAAAALGGPR